MSTWTPKFEGSRYAETRDLDIREVAKLVRKDIKAAKKAGKLPKELKTSVRISRFAGGQSLDVRLSGIPALNPSYLCALARDPYNHSAVRYHIPRLLPAMTEAQKLIKGIVSAYNMDDSDSMTDYFCNRFYSDVEVDWKHRSAEREQHQPLVDLWEAWGEAERADVRGDDDALQAMQAVAVACDQYVVENGPCEQIDELNEYVRSALRPKPAPVAKPNPEPAPVVEAPRLVLVPAPVVEAPAPVAATVRDSWGGARAW